MFTSMVVALDLEPGGDRVLPLVAQLARRSAIPIELATVTASGPNWLADRDELRRRALALGAGRASWAVLEDVDVAGALLRRLGRENVPLLVMATSARSPVASSVFGGVVHDVLRGADIPVLLVGPHAELPGADLSTLVIGVDPLDTSGRAVPAVLAWHATFTSAAPVLVEVVRPGADTRMASWRSDELSGLLAAQHLHARVETVSAASVVDGMDGVADDLVGAIHVTTSSHYTDGRLHWHSRTQELLAGSRYPVLVVPARSRNPLTVGSLAVLPSEAPSWRLDTDVAVPPVVPAPTVTSVTPVQDPG